MSEPTDQVVRLDADSAPRLLHFGNELRLERFPAGTRVLYPRNPLPGVPHLRQAVRQALAEPLDSAPLKELAVQARRVTIAVDDNAVPLPLMQRPDARQSVLEEVLEVLTAAGVEDIELVVAQALHRKLRPAEIRRMVGPRVGSALGADRIGNHDAEDPHGIMQVGSTADGAPVAINRRAAESDLLIYVNVTQVPLNGGHKSAAVGLADYDTIRVHHDPQVMRATPSFMAPDSSRMHHCIDAGGRVIAEAVRIFQIEVALDNRMFGGALNFLMKREEELTLVDRVMLRGSQAALRLAGEAGRRAIMGSVRGAFGVLGVHAGAVEAVHRQTLPLCQAQTHVALDAPADILVSGVPGLGPYNVASVQNPIITQVMALGYAFNMHRGTSPLKQGGTFIICHPLPGAFDAATHPSYVPFFHQVLAETRDAEIIAEKHEPRYARDPDLIRAYRESYAFHPAHPFFLWYWGERARQWVGRIIVAGARQPDVAERLGWEHAADLATALAMAGDSAPPDPSILLLRHPPIAIAALPADSVA